ASTGAAAAGARRLASRGAETCPSRRLLPWRAGSTRRRTSACPPSCSPDASRSVRARWQYTMSWQRARGRRTPGGAGDRPSESHPRARALVGADPVVHHLVQVSAHELLVAQREGRHDTRLEPHLRRLEGAAVLQGVLLDGGDAQLLGEAFAHAAWGGEVSVR